MPDLGDWKADYRGYFDAIPEREIPDSAGRTAVRGDGAELAVGDRVSTSYKVRAGTNGSVTAVHTVDSRQVSDDAALCPTP